MATNARRRGGLGSNQYVTKPGTAQMHDDDSLSQRVSHMSGHRSTPQLHSGRIGGDSTYPDSDLIRHLGEYRASDRSGLDAMHARGAISRRYPETYTRALLDHEDQCLESEAYGYDEPDADQITNSISSHRGVRDGESRMMHRMQARMTALSLVHARGAGEGEYLEEVEEVRSRMIDMRLQQIGF